MVELQRKGMAVTRSFGSYVRHLQMLMGAVAQYAMRAGGEDGVDRRGGGLKSGLCVSIGALGGTGAFEAAFDPVSPTGTYLDVRKLAADQTS